MNRWIAAMMMLSAACAKGKSAAACREEAHGLVTMLRAIDHALPVFQIRDEALVVRPDLPRVDPGSGQIIELTSERTALNGRPITDRAELGVALAQLHAKAAESPYRSRDEPLLYLVIGAQTPWRAVVEVAEAAVEAGFTRAAFAFGVPPDGVPPPPRSSVDDELDRLQASDEPENKATRLAELTSKVVRKCSALGRAFGVVGDEGGDRAAQLIDGIEPALIECGCNLDVPALRSIMYRLLHVDHPSTALVVTLATDGRAVAQPAPMPWAEASRLVVADAPLHLTVAP